MKVRFLETAERELEDAVDYYELESDGLGLRFKSEVKSALVRVPAFLMLGPLKLRTSADAFCINSRTSCFTLLSLNTSSWSL